MKSAVVIGRIMATRKVESLTGVKLLLLRRTGWDGTPMKEVLVAADAVGAGAGEHVFFVEARDASIAVQTNPPIDAAIVGIIDGADFESGY
ncbi:EutN/CcmL family microcompartment protein [bacterium]|nr:EutN/CcmL family microcompartment protein [candidate division CSSED10-310 bacterium]